MAGSLVGRRFGSLVVLRESRTSKGKIRCIVRCDCGNTRTVYRDNVQRGLTQSCGCLNRLLVMAQHNAWAQTSVCHVGRISGVDQYEVTVLQPKLGVLRGLRCERYHGLCSLATLLPELPRRHGTETVSPTLPGSDRQQRELRACQLSLGDGQPAGQQPKTAP
jgi:hypothetical protein